MVGPLDYLLSGSEDRFQVGLKGCSSAHINTITEFLEMNFKSAPLVW